MILKVLLALVLLDGGHARPRSAIARMALVGCRAPVVRAASTALPYAPARAGRRDRHVAHARHALRRAC
jgi:hypothetical protein